MKRDDKDAPPLSPVEPLSARHDVASFDCGESALNRFLKRYALINQQAHSARTYVACREQVVVGYYTLVAGSAEPRDVPARIQRGLARHSVPLLLIARLAVDRAEQGTGLGKALLKDALLRCSNVADIAGVRAVVVHAKSDAARSWYEHFDFEPSPTDPYHLFLLMKDLRALLRDR